MLELLEHLTREVTETESQEQVIVPPPKAPATQPADMSSSEDDPDSPEDDFEY